MAGPVDISQQPWADGAAQGGVLNGDSRGYSLAKSPQPSSPELPWQPDQYGLERQLCSRREGLTSFSSHQAPQGTDQSGEKEETSPKLHVSGMFFGNNQGSVLNAKGLFYRQK